jgi:hypothetical protein
MHANKEEQETDGMVGERFGLVEALDYIDSLDNASNRFASIRGIRSLEKDSIRDHSRNS